ncbi:MAG: M20/M25/M40 family metallo-hydrolase, partial [bacterium]|nr:M20/M25/M40 family metallo-hydrolase [bacterium]
MKPEAAGIVLERTIELASVPAPPLDEADRAANVVARLRDGQGPATFVAAHLDTVFGRDVPHRAEQHGTRLNGPGVGDNTVSVAALSVLDALLPRQLDRPVWIVATVGEEGLGNLAGVLHLVQDPPAGIGALIALEGNYLGRVVTVGVGSVRWSLELAGPGGHAWEAADNPSTIHDLARIIARLDPLLATPAAGPGARSTSVTSREESPSTSEPGGLRFVSISPLPTRWFSPISIPEPAAWVNAEKSPLVTANFKELGKRPAGSIPAAHPLVKAAADALAEVGIQPEYAAASNDANAAGIPAITLGITVGSGEHT